MYQEYVIGKLFWNKMSGKWDFLLMTQHCQPHWHFRKDSKNHVTKELSHGLAKRIQKLLVWQKANLETEVFDLTCRAASAQRNATDGTRESGCGAGPCKHLSDSQGSCWIRLSRTKTTGWRLTASCLTTSWIWRFFSRVRNLGRRLSFSLPYRTGPWLKSILLASHYQGKS